jgi:hypothetical protein
LSNDFLAYASLVLGALFTGILALFAMVSTMRLANCVQPMNELSGNVSTEHAGLLRKCLARNRPWLRTEAIGAAAAVFVAGFIFQIVTLSKTPVPSWTPAAPYGEEVQSKEWHSWRARVHEILSPEPVTEKTLAEALRVKLPGLPNSPSEAEILRRDQAIADVLLSYDGVRKILAKRFGIYKDFLGTGLSKPLGPTPYALTAVHEYLVENHRDTHPHIWLWKFDPPSKAFSQTLQSLIAGESDRIFPDNHQKKTRDFESELSEILLRVKNKHHPLPPMVRFARFNHENYRGTLGRPEAFQVFTSNLSEVWDLTIQQAAEKSGYKYKEGGDTLFIWVFVPYHSNEFAPATWRQVFENMPDWLDKHAVP